MKILAIIPARGGSKGVPGKNIRIVHGKPLIAWTIEASLHSQWIGRTIVSTDDLSIAETAIKFGAEVPFIRDAYLAKDDTPTIDVVFDVFKRFPDYEWGVLLQPTSPLRTADDIDELIAECFKFKAYSSVSVSLVEENPYWMYEKDENNYLTPLFDQKNISRRQDLPKFYCLNGAIYFFHRKWLEINQKFVTQETLAYEMPQARSIDLDTENDFKHLNGLMEI